MTRPTIEPRAILIGYSEFNELLKNARKDDQRWPALDIERMLWGRSAFADDHVLIYLVITPPKLPPPKPTIH